jgi:glucosylceramidase
MIIKPIILTLTLFVCFGFRPIEKVEWVSTSNTAPWQVKTVDAITSATTKSNLVINTKKTQQTIEGFGGCFNEMGWDALNKLKPEDKALMLQLLFDQQTGCKFNLCRMPLGANDYSMDWYSLNENAGDFAMEKFSIDRDKTSLIPYIHEAQKHFPALRVWASPWCPPSWMKKNNHYACRPDVVNDLKPEGAGAEMADQFIMEDNYLKAYALYFSKFVKAYAQESIQIDAVHVQNEMNSCQNFPSCIWTPESLGRFIADYLGPQFKNDKLSTKIWLGTVERPQIERVDGVLNYPGAKKYIAGVGFQWAGQKAIPEVHKKYPKLNLMQTETECGDGSNDWAAAVHTFGLMKHYFENGANAYMYWNMILDETGLSYWKWKQNSMISVNPETKSYRLNPEFFLMKHFSAFVERGAKKLASPNNDPNCIVFKNAKSVVIFYYNAGEAKEKTFKINKQHVTVKFESETFNTLKINL